MTNTPQPPSKFGDSPYQVAVLGAGVAANAALAGGIATAISQPGFQLDLASYADDVRHFSVEALFPPYPNDVIHLLQIVLFFVYGLFLSHYIWTRSDAFDQNAAVGYVLVDAIICLSFFLLAYTASLHTTLFRFASVAVFILWTIRALTIPRSSPHHDEIRSAVRTYTILAVVISLAMALVTGVFVVPSDGIDEPRMKERVDGVFDLGFTVIPLIWAIALVIRKLTFK